MSDIDSETAHRIASLLLNCGHNSIFKPIPAVERLQNQRSFYLLFNLGLESGLTNFRQAFFFLAISLSHLSFLSYLQLSPSFSSVRD